MAKEVKYRLYADGMIAEKDTYKTVGFINDPEEFERIYNLSGFGRQKALREFINEQRTNQRVS